MLAISLSYFCNSLLLISFTPANIARHCPIAILMSLQIPVCLPFANRIKLKLLSDIRGPSIKTLSYLCKPMTPAWQSTLFCSVHTQNLSAWFLLVQKVSVTFFSHQNLYEDLELLGKLHWQFQPTNFLCSVSTAPNNTTCSHITTFFPIYIRNTLQFVICMSCLSNKNVSSFGSKKFHTMPPLISDSILR